MEREGSDEKDISMQGIRCSRGEKRDERWRIRQGREYTRSITKKETRARMHGVNRNK